MTEKFSPKLKEVLIHTPYIKKDSVVKSLISDKVNSPETENKIEPQKESLNFDKLYFVNHIKEKI